ncbi:hypothetical protein LTR56_017396 [Elasticomyces elasticus]|nr:hypothetical protein LTR56_017396 [Elasticomyces elasticus]KAK3639080.1 hypothetical protein LTR22_017608 [Elasticomyces elasticus]KAK4915621.1 hypothetical protein LTR49_016223 [Elasticomyces elasticus]KAK5752607.1 hypothetical protein LTS12_017270 [Elasticomyces elasticus]
MAAIPMMVVVIRMWKYVLMLMAEQPAARSYNPNFRKYPQLLAFRDGLGMQQQWKDDIHQHIGPANHAAGMDGGKRKADRQAFSQASTLYVWEPRALAIRAITGDWFREKDVGVHGKALAKTSRGYMKLLEVMDIASEHC